MSDPIKRAEPFLRQCGSCDAGLPQNCTCPPQDYRPTMLDLVRELEEARTRIGEMLSPPMFRVKAGKHEGRIGARVALGQRVVPLSGRTYFYTIMFREGDTADIWEWAVERL